MDFHSVPCESTLQNGKIVISEGVEGKAEDENLRAGRILIMMQERKRTIAY
jgi:hypothetical protein